jgi:hypothetical protein
MKTLVGAAIVAAAFAFAGPVAAVPADAATPAVKHDTSSSKVTDFSAGRRHRHYGRRHFHRHHRHFHHRRYYAPRYYRPYYRSYYRPYYYRPYYGPRYYYRPYYYGPRPFVSFGFGFGPRWGW